MAQKILIVAPDRGLAARLRERLPEEDDRLELISPDDGLSLALSEREDTAYLVSLDAPDPLAWISRLRSGNPHGRVIAAGDGAPVELILAALDAGADDCLDIAGDLLPLLRALDLGEQREDEAVGRLICFLSAQHASGASTAAAQTASTLAADQGERVLLVELDFHSGSLAFRLRLDPDKTIAELSRYWHIPEQAWGRAVSFWNGVDVLSAPATVNQLRLGGLPPFVEIVRVARRRYDAVVADLPTGMSGATRVLLRQSWRTYLFCTPELASLHLARRRTREILEAGVSESDLRLVVSRWSAGSVLDEAEISSVVGLPIAFKLPNDYAGIRAADQAGAPIAPNRHLSKALRKIAHDAADPAGPRPRAADARQPGLARP